jgi:hypothetical protein
MWRWRWPGRVGEGIETEGCWVGRLSRYVGWMVVFVCRDKVRCFPQQKVTRLEYLITPDGRKIGRRS